MPGESVPPESVMARLEQIVKSPPLGSSPSLCRFLRYVVQETLAGRSGSLKEYSLGVAVFDRGDNFDPRLDPIVRVQARNLRVRLSQYYSGPGVEDTVVIDLPKRTYVPVFHEREVETAAGHGENDAAGAPEAPPEARGRRRAPAPAARMVAVLALAVVAAGLGAVWHVRQNKTVVALREPDPAAQDLYIRGRYVMDRQTESALREAIDCFRRSAERDPKFAPAYAGMSQAYNILAQYGYIPPGEGMEQARRLAQQALDADPGLAEGHVALAAVMEAYDWNWTAAEREYRRALELNGWLPAAHLWYGMFLRDQGRLNEALPELRRAAQMEPFSVLTTINLAHAYMAAGNDRAAAEQALHATELAPRLAMAYVVLASAYSAEKKPAESEAALARALPLAADNPHDLAVLARAYAWRKMRKESVALLRQLEDLSKRRYVSPYDMGSVSLGLGDEKRALDLLEEAYRQRSSGLIFLRTATFAGMEHSAEFESLVQKMHFAG